MTQTGIPLMIPGNKFIQDSSTINNASGWLVTCHVFMSLSVFRLITGCQEKQSYAFFPDMCKWLYVLLEDGSRYPQEQSKKKTVCEGKKQSRGRAGRREEEENKWVGLLRFEQPRWDYHYHTSGQWMRLSASGNKNLINHEPRIN